MASSALSYLRELLEKNKERRHEARHNKNDARKKRQNKTQGPFFWLFDITAEINRSAQQIKDTANDTSNGVAQIGGY